MFLRMASISLLLLASAGAQTVNVHQIRPGSNGRSSRRLVASPIGAQEVLPLVYASPAWRTYTTVTGLVVNGVSLASGGSSTLFLNQAGTYTAPPTGATTFAGLLSGTNTSMAAICGTGCSMQPSGSGTITPNAVNLAGTGNGGVFGNLPPSNLNGGTGSQWNYVLGRGWDMEVCQRWSYQHQWRSWSLHFRWDRAELRWNDLHLWRRRFVWNHRTHGRAYSSRWVSDYAHRQFAYRRSN